MTKADAAWNRLARNQGQVLEVKGEVRTRPR